VVNGSTRYPGWVGAGGRFSLMVAATAAVLACPPAADQRADTTRATATAQMAATASVAISDDNPDCVTPAPTFIQPADVAPRGQVMEYAGNLRFRQTLGYSAFDKMLVGGKPGPEVWIYPECGAHHNDMDALRRGRILARLVNKDPKTDYAPLAVKANDTAYWWVDGSVGGKLRSVFVPRDPTLGVVVMGLKLEQDQSDVWPYSYARFRASQAVKTWMGEAVRSAVPRTSSADHWWSIRTLWAAPGDTTPKGPGSGTWITCIRGCCVAIN
jgi:hypothetical protein